MCAKATENIGLLQYQRVCFILKLCFWQEVSPSSIRALSGSEEQPRRKAVAKWKTRVCCLELFVSLNVSNNSEYFFLKQVASIYKDPSIGNLINIVIVKLVVIHNEQVMEGSFFTFCLTVAFVVSIAMNN